MVGMVVIFAVISGMASTRGYKSPLFGGFGLACYFVLSIPIAIAMQGEGYSEFAACIVTAVVTILGFAGLIHLLPRRDARAAPKTSAAPFWLMGLVCLLLAMLFALGWASSLSSGRSETTTLILAGVCLTGAISCFRYQSQSHLPGTTEVLAHDHRPPVLFLRSFASDHMRKKSSLGFLPLYPTEFGKSFEEFLAPAAAKLGPFVALGDPEDYLPSFGAAKVYQRDDSWQQTVLDLLARADYVFLLEGASPGLSWELNQVRSRCAPDKVYILTPPRSFPRIGWEGFARLLRECGFEIPTDPGPGSIVGFDAEFRPVILLRKSTRIQDFLRTIAKSRPSTAGIRELVSDDSVWSV